MTVIQKYLIIALAVLLLISIGVNVVYHFDRASLKADVTTLTNNNKILTAQVATDKAAIADQNQKISDAAAKAQKDAQTILDLGKTLFDQQTIDQRVIDNLSKVPAPKTCTDAANYLKNNLEIYQW